MSKYQTLSQEDKNLKARKYSVILPTYNERENLPVIIYLIMKMADEKYYIFFYKWIFIKKSFNFF